MRQKQASWQRVVLIRESPPPWLSQTPIRRREDIVEATRALIRDDPREVLWVWSLDGAHRVIGYRQVSVGTVNASLIHPREVFQAAILDGATAIILTHNHPSGSSQPSSEDVAISQRLIEAGRILGIKVLDHVVIGDGETSSAIRSMDV